MKYFEKYTNEGKDDIQKKLKLLDDLDITVQWSTQVFQWILNYIKNVPKKNLIINPEIAIPILISADSLVIEPLIIKWCEYIRDNLQAVVSVRSTNQTLKSSIIKTLAKLIPLDVLDNVKPENDQLVGRIYK
jgi:hypothetical protein